MGDMNRAIQTTDRRLVSGARLFWYGMRPIWWRNYWGLSVGGLENLPHRGAMIFCANHASHLDAAAILAALPREMALEVTTVAARDVWGGNPLRSLGSRLTTNAIELEREGGFCGGFSVLGGGRGVGGAVLPFF